MSRMPGRIQVALLCAAVAAAPVALAQRADVLERKSITAAKQALVSGLEKQMPRVTLDYFLQTEAGKDGSIAWEGNDCGEQTGDPADANRDFPICGQATVEMRDGHKVIVMIAVGSYTKGVYGTPQVWLIEGVAPDGNSSPLRLSEVPAFLHPGHRSPREQRDSTPARHG